MISDGEVVALDEQGRQDFRLLMAGEAPSALRRADVPWLKGKDLREFPLSRPKRILSRLVTKSSTVLSSVLNVHRRGRHLFGAVERWDLERVVAKRPRASGLRD